MRPIPVLISVLLLAACESSPDPRPDSARPVTTAPPGLQPTRLAPALLSAVDTNANRRPDTLVVVVYLFAPDASPLPFHAPGQLTFTLMGQAEQPIATWTFPKDEAATRQDADAIGPRYTFTLDLLAAAGTDDLTPQTALMAVAFTRPDGVTINAVDPVAIRVGLP